MIRRACTNGGRSRPGRFAHRLRLGQKTARLGSLWPSPENSSLYRTQRSVADLVASIKRDGILQPLIVTRDSYIVSGHRRWVAAHRAGLKTVPIDVQDFRRQDDPDQFIRLLREHNRYRDKSFDETLRETLIDKKAEENGWQRLLDHRFHRAETDEAEGEYDVIPGWKIKLRTAVIAPERKQLLQATVALVEQRRKWWPMGMRAYYYGLLKVPRLMRNTEQCLPFASDRASYRATCNVINDAMRLGLIPRDAVADETRAVVLARCWRTVREFLSYELDAMLTGYEHDLLQSQPNHIEIVGEKLTIQGVIQSVADGYTMPVTIGRGFCSPPVLRDIAQRFRDSRQAKLILLTVTDCDPEGIAIPEAIGKTLLEHSEGLIDSDELLIVPVALRMRDVKRLKLQPSYDAGESASSRKPAYQRKHGTLKSYELEAAEPDDIACILDEAIREFIDIETFNAEVETHNANREQVHDLREKIGPVLRKLLLK